VGVLKSYCVSYTLYTVSQKKRQWRCTL